MNVNSINANIQSQALVADLKSKAGSSHTPTYDAELSIHRSKKTDNNRKGRRKADKGKSHGKNTDAFVKPKAFVHSLNQFLVPL